MKKFTKDEINDLQKRNLDVISYIRGYYQPLFKDKRYLQAQKLACASIIKSGIDRSSDLFKNAVLTYSRMTKKEDAVKKAPSKMTDEIIDHSLESVVNNLVKKETTNRSKK